MSEQTAGDVPYAMGGKKRGSLFSKLSGKPEEETPPPAQPKAAPQPAAAQTAAAPPQEKPAPARPAEDEYSMKLRPSNATRMVVPKDVEITGAINSRSATDIAGRVDGDVAVEAPLLLAEGSTITGKVKAARCRLDGRVEGGVDCTEDFEVGPTGVLESNAMAGKNIRIAGTVNGSIRCGGKLHLMSTARITGDVRARSLVVDEGAQFNGECSMTSQNKK